MHVDLLVPLFPPAHWNFAFAMDIEGSAYSHPPLGVATLAAHTPSHVEVRIFDENVAPIPIDELAPIVGISAMYIQREQAFKLARRCRESGRLVVMGGGLVEAVLELCMDVADVCFVGEAELTWPRFLADLAENKPDRVYRAEQRFDLSAARLPRYDLLQARRYSTGSVQTSRGCPYRCEYCDVPRLDGGRPRTKSVHQVMEEVRQLHGLGHDSIFFVDDHFLGDRTFASKLLDELADFIRTIDYAVVFYCQATLNVASDDELLRKLYLANFRRLFIGIESDNHQALRSANKAHNTRLPVAEAVRRIQSWNIVVWAALLLGFDDDDEQTVDRYLRFAREAGIGMVIPGILQAVPRTPYHDRVKAEKRLVPLRNGYVGGQAGSLDSLLVSNVEPRRMTYSRLLREYQRFAAELYRPEIYAERLIRALSAGTQAELGPLRVEGLFALRALLWRTLRYYATAPLAQRRMFFDVLWHVAKTRGFRAHEAAFHLVIYKHLQEFYRQAATSSVPLAADLTRAVNHA